LTAERTLIVNADDLGLSDGVNAGIAEAHANGVVTSASLMVRRSAAPAAVEVSRSHPRLAVGLHFDLGEWVYEDGRWRVAYERCSSQDPSEVERECRAQVEAFRDLLGRDPTHLDSHQHVHMREPVAAVAIALAEELGVPLRDRGVRYEGGFYGQTGTGEPWPEGISVERLVELVESLPQGWTEIGCHPGLDVRAESSYAAERERELHALCDPRVRKAIERAAVRLRSFADVRRGGAGIGAPLS
jgi:chitin disaccharide deacetylase